MSPKTRLPDSLIRHNGESHDGKSQSEATSPLQQYRVIARTSEVSSMWWWWLSLTNVCLYAQMFVFLFILLLACLSACFSVYFMLFSLPICGSVRFPPFL